MSWLIDALHSQMYSILTGLIFLVLNIFDGHSTWLVIRPHYYHREKNPVARWAFKKLGLPQGIVIFKTVLLLILAAAMTWYGYYDPFTLNIVLSVANLVFIIVVWHNYRTYRKIKALR